MNQLCKVCGEPAAGFHFGAFTCEGCKSFFGRTYNNISAIAGCKNNGDCVINKKNRTACKACRLRKCLLVGMSKSGSRYGRRSNWFKIHCLLQEQQSQQTVPGSTSAASANFEQLARLHQIQARQTYQDKTNPCIKSASLSPTLRLPTSTGLSKQVAAATAAQQQQQQQQHLPHYLTTAKFLNGIDAETKSEPRLSATPSDSGASSAGDAAEDCRSSISHEHGSNQSGRQSAQCTQNDAQPQLEQQQNDTQAQERRQKQLLHIFRSHSEPLKIFAPLSMSMAAKSPFASYAISNLPPPILTGTPPMHFLPASSIRAVPEDEQKSVEEQNGNVAAQLMAVQHEPIDLSVKTRESLCRKRSSSPAATTAFERHDELGCLDVIARPAPLDLTLVRTQSLTG